MKIINQQAKYQDGQVWVTYTTDDGNTQTKTLDEFDRFKEELKDITKVRPLTSTPEPTPTPTNNYQLTTTVPVNKVPDKEFNNNAHRASHIRNLRRGGGQKQQTLDLNYINPGGGEDAIDVLAPELKGLPRQGRQAIQFGSTKEVPDANLAEVADAVNHNQLQGIATLGRMVLNSGLDLAQEYSDTFAYDLPAAFGLGESTTKENPNRNFLRVFPPLPYLKHENGNHEVENIATGFLQFGLGMATGGKLASAATKGALKLTPVGAKALSKFNKLPNAVRNIATSAGQGAVVDFAGFDQYEGRLTDIVEAYVQGADAGNIKFDQVPVIGDALDAATEGLVNATGGSLTNVPLVGMLVSGENDDGLAGRWKNVVEGAIVGTAADIMIAVPRSVRSSKKLATNFTEYTTKQQEFIASLGLDSKDLEYKKLISEGNTSEEVIKGAEQNSARLQSFLDGTAPEMKPYRDKVLKSVKDVRDNALLRNKAVQNLEASVLNDLQLKFTDDGKLIPNRDNQVTIAEEQSKNPIQLDLDLDGKQSTTETTTTKVPDETTNEVPNTTTEKPADTPATDVSTTAVDPVETRTTGLKGLLEKTKGLLVEANKTAQAAKVTNRAKAKTVARLRVGINNLESLKKQVELTQLDELEKTRDLTDAEKTKKRVLKENLGRGVRALSTNEMQGLLDLDSATIGELQFDQQRLQGTIDAIKANADKQDEAILLSEAATTAEIERLVKLKTRQQADLDTLQKIGSNSKEIKKLKTDLDETNPRGIRTRFNKKNATVAELDKKIQEEVVGFAAKQESGEIRGVKGIKEIEAHNKKIKALTERREKLSDELSELDGQLKTRLDRLVTLETTRTEAIDKYFKETVGLEEFDPEFKPSAETNDPVQTEANNQPSPEVTQTSSEADGVQTPRAVTLESTEPVIDNAPVILNTPGGSTAGNLFEVRASGSVGKQLVNQGNVTYKNGILVVNKAPLETSPYSNTTVAQRFYRRFLSMDEQQMLAAIDKAPKHLQQRLFGIYRTKLASDRLKELLSTYGDNLKNSDQFLARGEDANEAVTGLIMDLWRAERYLANHTGAAGRFVIGEGLGLLGKGIANVGLGHLVFLGGEAMVTMAPGVIGHALKSTHIPWLQGLGMVFEDEGAVQGFISNLNLFGDGATGVAENLGLKFGIGKGVEYLLSKTPIIGNIEQGAEFVSNTLDSLISDQIKDSAEAFTRWFRGNEELKKLDTEIRNTGSELKDLKRTKENNLKIIDSSNDPVTVAKLEKQNLDIDESITLKTERINTLNETVGTIFREIPDYAEPTAQFFGNIADNLTFIAHNDMNMLGSALMRTLRLTASPLEAARGLIDISLSGGADKQVGVNIQGDTLFLNGHQQVRNTVIESAEIATREVEGLIDPGITYTFNIPGIEKNYTKPDPIKTIINSAKTVDTILEGTLETAGGIITTSKTLLDSSLELNKSISNAAGELITSVKGLVGLDGQPLASSTGLVDSKGQPLASKSTILGPDGKPLANAPTENTTLQENLQAKQNIATTTPEVTTTKAEPFNREELPVNEPVKETAVAVGGFFQNLLDNIRQGEPTTESPTYQPFNRDELPVNDPIGEFFPNDGWTKHQEAVDDAMDKFTQLFKIVGKSPKAALSLATDLITRGDQSMIQSSSLPIDTYVGANNLPMVINDQITSLAPFLEQLPINMEGVRKLFGSGASKEQKKKYVGIVRTIKLAMANQLEWADTVQYIIGLKAEADLKLGFGRKEGTVVDAKVEASRNTAPAKSFGDALQENAQTSQSLNAAEDKLVRDIESGATVLDVDVEEIKFTDIEKLENFANDLKQTTKNLYNDAKKWVKNRIKSTYTKYQQIQTTLEDSVDAPQFEADRAAREALAMKVLGIKDNVGDGAKQLLDLWRIAYQSDPASVLEKKLEKEPPWLKAMARASFAASVAKAEIASATVARGLGSTINTTLNWIGKAENQIWTDPLKLGEATGIYEGQTVDLQQSTKKYVKDNAKSNAGFAEQYVNNRIAAAALSRGAKIVGEAKKIGINIRAFGKAVESKLPWDSPQPLSKSTQQLQSLDGFNKAAEEGDLTAMAENSDKLALEFPTVDDDVPTVNPLRSLLSNVTSVFKRNNISAMDLAKEDAKIEVDAITNGTNEINGEQNVLLKGNSDARSYETSQLAYEDDGSSILQSVENAPLEDRQAVELTASAVDGSPDVIDELPTAGTVEGFPISDIQVDPEKFQTPGGIVVNTYQPQLAGELQVWFDADGELGEPGKTWLINGHHRLKTATASNSKRVNVHYLPNDVVESADEAGILGAIQNTFDRSGQLVDGAQALRNDAATPAMKEYIAKTYWNGEDAVKLSRIPDGVFNLVDEQNIGKMVALGDRDLPPTTLEQVWNIAKDENWSAFRIKSVVADVASRGQNFLETLKSEGFEKRVSIREAMSKVSSDPLLWDKVQSSPQVRKVMDEMTSQMLDNEGVSLELMKKYKPKLEDAGWKYLEDDLKLVEIGGTEISEAVYNTLIDVRSSVGKGDNKYSKLTEKPC